METVPCPGCGAKIEATASECPVCRRSRSAREISRSMRGAPPPEPKAAPARDWTDDLKPQKPGAKKGGGGIKCECPGCRSIIDATAQECPICTRPRRAEEIARSLREARPGAAVGRFLRRLRPLALVALLGGLGAYARREGVFSSLLDAAKKFNDEVSSRPRNPETAAAPAPEPGRPTEDAAPDSAANPALSADSMRALSDRLGLNDRARASEPEREPEEAPGWRIQGRVYDLITLKPVPELRVTLTDNLSGRRFAARSDKRGEYALTVPPLSEGGYAVSIQHKRYGKRYLEEMSPPYRTQGLNRRREEDELMRNAAVLHVPILLQEGQRELEYSIILPPP